MKCLSWSFISSVLLVLGLNGCGGGGGSPSGPTLSQIPSNAVAAEPTMENAQAVAESVQSDPSEMLPGLGLNSVEQESVGGVQVANQAALKLKKIVRKSVDEMDTYALNETVNQSYDCSGGGSGHMTGSGTDGGDFTVTVTYNQCVEYGMTMNGSMKASLSGYDSSVDDYSTIKIDILSTLSISDSGMSMEIATGSYIYMYINEFDYDYYEAIDFTMDTSLVVTVNGEKYAMENASYNFVYDPDTETATSTQARGRLYISSDLSEYVDLDTSYNPAAQFSYDLYGLVYGTGHYIMANNARLTIEAHGDGSYTATINDNGTITSETYYY